MNNVGNNKDTIPITMISNFPMPISVSVKAKVFIIFYYIKSFMINNSL